MPGYRIEGPWQNTIYGGPGWLDLEMVVGSGDKSTVGHDQAKPGVCVCV